MICPVMKKKCIKDKCAWWVKLMLKEKDSMKEISSCAVPMLVDVGIDTGKNVARVQSAVESDRNVTNSARNILLKVLHGQMGSQKVIGG